MPRAPHPAPRRGGACGTGCRNTSGCRPDGPWSTFGAVLFEHFSTRVVPPRGGADTHRLRLMVRRSCRPTGPDTGARALACPDVREAHTGPPTGDDIFSR